MNATTIQRTGRRALLALALTALAAGVAAWFSGRPQVALWAWTAGAAPVALALLVAIARDLVAGRMGVDAIAFLAMLGALALGEPLAGVVVAVMYAGGAVLEDVAMARAERDLRALADRAPRIARRRGAAGVEDVPVDDVAIGDALVVRAGEVTPVDGAVTAPGALLDESALTGEPVPVRRAAGEIARSGVLNAGDTFEMRAVATARESAYAGVVRMVAAAQSAKAPFTRVADRYALLLLPFTLVVAGAAWFASGDPVRALAVLVAATPCPLILAAPVAFLGGVSRAARIGVLIKGGGPLEALARVRTVVFDKTGTLTVGGARLIAIETRPGQAAEDVLRLAASLEQASHHVVAASVVAAARARGLALEMPTNVRETMGAGLEGALEGRRVRIGSYELVCGAAKPEDWALRILRRAASRSALSVFVAVDGLPIGALLLGDELRRETPRALQTLRKAGVARIVMLTGDRADAAEAIGAALDIDAVLADRTPSDKVDAVADEQRGAPTLMVGDGINDAPALAAADVGAAMGARGASASSDAADVVVLVDRLDRVAEAVVIARRARRIALQSIVAGMGLSGVAMGFAAFGYLPPVAGAIVQEVIDVAVILNALRALGPGRGVFARAPMAADMAADLARDHAALGAALDRLRALADALDDLEPADAVGAIAEANAIVRDVVVVHERADEREVFPRVARFLVDDGGLGAMSRAHREIWRLARRLDRLSGELTPQNADRTAVRDAQRVIENLESLVRMHNAQEEDIYDHAASN